MKYVLNVRGVNEIVESLQKIHETRGQCCGDQVEGNFHLQMLRDAQAVLLALQVVPKTPEEIP